MQALVQLRETIGSLKALAHTALINQLFQGERKGAGAGTTLVSCLVSVQGRVQSKVNIIEVNRSPHTG